MKTIDLSNTVTAKDLQEIFGVSSLTSVWKWRKQHGLDSCAIKIHANERYFIRYDLTCVLKWAKEHGKNPAGLTKWKRKQQKSSKKKQRVRI